MALARPGDTMILRTSKAIGPKIREQLRADLTGATNALGIRVIVIGNEIENVDVFKVPENCAIPSRAPL